MEIDSLRQRDIPEVMALMDLGGPYLVPRTASDYWLYAKLFSTTCLVARIDGELVGAVMAFRSQDEPDDVYIQDVVTHPAHRRAGIATALLAALRERAERLGAPRLYLTSEPGNTAAHATWTRLGFTNVSGDRTVEGVSVIDDYKGLGRHRAVYELSL